MSQSEKVGGAVLIVLGLVALGLVVFFVVTGFAVENHRAYAGGNVAVDATSKRKFSGSAYAR